MDGWHSLVHAAVWYLCRDGLTGFLSKYSLATQTFVLRTLLR